MLKYDTVALFFLCSNQFVDYRLNHQLQEQIFRQSSQIMQLERMIQNQEKELQSKNFIIQSLISKLQKNHSQIR